MHCGKVPHLLVGSSGKPPLVEYILLVSLGFLSAILLTLLVAPSIWRRAVYLTEKRIRATVPLTLEEVRAEKDKLRAEFAMTARRYEMKIDDLVSKSAQQLAQNAAGEETILQLREDGERKAERIAQMEAELETGRAEYARQGEELDSCIADLRAAETQIESKLMEIERLERELTEASLSASNFQIDLAAAETDVERLREQLRDKREQLRAVEDRSKELASDLKLSVDLQKTTAQRLSETETRLEDAKASIIALEEKLERRESELTRLHEEAKAKGRLVSEAERKAESALKQLARHEREFEKLSGLFDDFKDRRPERGEIKKMVSKLITDRASLAKKLTNTADDKAKLESDVGDLTRQLAATGAGAGQGAEDLREKIGDIAARVVHMTAMLEGSKSPVHTALEKAGPEIGEQVNGAAIPSLAERIRSLQKVQATTN